MVVVFFILKGEVISVIKIERQCIEVYCHDVVKVQHFRK